ncbi:MAG: pyruvate/2-oxoglutarate/acetoin dehydrogenase E1 component [Candidatus Omnitrophota bacterium]|jgi:pyruvate/2-oxoglutarate/acetoin dehydrogenase E1 component
MTYFDELKRTMEWLAEQDKTMFLGQTVAGPGTFMFQTLRDVPKEKALEMPINESFQMQFTLGLALDGRIPISVYPRQNFLLLATGDMVNMIDKVPAISEGETVPKIIIRVASGPFKPVHPGHQHIGNYADGFRQMFDWIEVVELEEPEDIFPAYKHAYEREDNKSTLIIEHGNYYNDK